MAEVGDVGAANCDAFPLTAIDRELLAMKDEDFQLTTWAELLNIISSNRLEELKRRPSDVRRYLAWSRDVKIEYGSVTAFVIKERLHWTVLPAGDPSDPPTFVYNDPVPFADENDFRILRNDWPYGVADGITHICVWLKTPIATDSETGDVTAESRMLIERFVNKTFSSILDTEFGQGQGQGHVLWFKNWVSLQSVRGVDHIHVLVKDAPLKRLEEWTAP